MPNDTSQYYKTAEHQACQNTHSYTKEKAFSSTPNNEDLKDSKETMFQKYVPDEVKEYQLRSSHQLNFKWDQENDSSEEENEEFYKNITQNESKVFNNCFDNRLNCGPQEQLQEGIRASPQNFRQWSDDFHKYPQSFGRMTKVECDDIITKEYDTSNNEFDDPPSSNDFHDSNNDDEDSNSLNVSCEDERSNSLNVSCEDEREQFTADKSLRTLNCFEVNNSVECTDRDEESPSRSSRWEKIDSNDSANTFVPGSGGMNEETQIRTDHSNFPGVLDEKNIQYFTENIRKYTTYLECQNEVCRIENLREHYHCSDFPCCGKIISKKEEVIRHVKWHRKRLESLNYGFMRFSSSDDCSALFGANCQHNRKQTHYHCFQPNCDRVYISTSDVQMHSNFHRKDSAIYREGFQRFRANEVCNFSYCIFSGKKTTHFHCRRDNCRYTFKNKADMEKHKTYHIKDLKLARDGFKKFLKNEACPYRQCPFSKICNHIHCARENCFYVLHSSGQLLSHKRKHARIDNEQNYCRYKMIASKASLLKPSANVANISEITSLNLEQLKELEICPFVPKTSSDFPDSLGNNDLFCKEGSTIPSSSSSFSIEFLQQMKTRHEELLRQKQHLRLDPIEISTTAPEVSVFPVRKKTASPQEHMKVSSNWLPPSTIQQFFRTDCFSPNLDNEEPINLKNSNGQSQSFLESPCSSKEPHLHCIVTGCDAVIPNNISDISTHIRLHGYNRDISASSESILRSSAGTSNNPMQITTIDGFFNRKRGRPPKNRFVEVYKNAQQSPQAIFTSFKLEKQTILAESEAMSSSSYCNQGLSIDKQQKNRYSEEAGSSYLSSSTSSLRETIQDKQTDSAQLFTYHTKENCRVAAECCPFVMQNHYHCTCDKDCTYVTDEKDSLNVHLKQRHTENNFTDMISRKYKRFDKTVGLDCKIKECRMRRTRSHLHCRQCFHQISLFEIETHVCFNPKERPMSLSPPKKVSTSLSPEEHNSEHNLEDELDSNFGKASDIINLPVKRKNNETETGTNNLAKQRHADEKILVVRAAGTYFPENTAVSSGISSPASPQKAKTSNEFTLSSMIPSLYCSTPYCKFKRKIHEHCEICDQPLVDPIKTKLHRLKHTVTPSPLTQMCTLEDNNKLKGLKQSPLNAQITLDDQPEDLSLSPNSSVTSSIEKIKTNIESPNNAVPSTTHLKSTFERIPKLLPPDLMGNLSVQHFYLAHLASLYQQNPYYNHQFHPFLSNISALPSHQQYHNVEPFRSSGNEENTRTLITTESTKTFQSPGIPCFTPIDFKESPSLNNFHFLSPLLMPRTTESGTENSSLHFPITTPISLDESNTLKRKHPNGSDDFCAKPKTIPPPIKKQLQFAAGLVVAAAAAASANNGSSIDYISAGTSNHNHHDQHGQHFKIKDEQIPTGYLKFRFNEDCLFPKCGYRNHQSHFHCDRNDCHYSFCDKTRFVQHTARHERLDKLMGNDFRQYRANMNCGYANCPYFKNLGSANKSSHFHCLKCDFICSDTNKVVAHRRQHSKMEYIRMAGFRKVTNSAKCSSSFEVTSNGSGVQKTGECSYSQKQTHYHCLVCDVSVLSRAQLASHKHKT